MLLEELRSRIKEKEKSTLDEKNRAFITAVDALFNDIDALSECHKSTMDYILYYLGYPFDDFRKIYDGLMKEVKQVYTLVDPEMFEKTLNYEERRTDNDRKES